VNSSTYSGTQFAPYKPASTVPFNLSPLIPKFFVWSRVIGSLGISEKSCVEEEAEKILLWYDGGGRGGKGKKGEGGGGGGRVMSSAGGSKG